MSFTLTDFKINFLIFLISVQTTIYGLYLVFNVRISKLLKFAVNVILSAKFN